MAPGGTAATPVATAASPKAAPAEVTGLTEAAPLEASQPELQADQGTTESTPHRIIPAGATPGAFPAAGADGTIPTDEEIEKELIDVLRTCYDPEIPVNIYDLGLIYDIKLDDTRNVAVKMTLTSPMCPVAGSLPPEVEEKVRALDGVASATVEVVWDPPWNPGMMSEAARLELDADGRGEAVYRIDAGGQPSTSSSSRTISLLGRRSIAPSG